MNHHMRSCMSLWRTVKVSYTQTTSCSRSFASYKGRMESELPRGARFLFVSWRGGSQDTCGTVSPDSPQLLVLTN